MTTNDENNANFEASVQAAVNKDPVNLRAPSLGETRVRAAFNPSADSTVDLVKQKTAELIDLCETLKPLDGRLAALAQTAYEEAAMWAVKAATTPKS